MELGRHPLQFNQIFQAGGESFTIGVMVNNATTVTKWIDLPLFSKPSTSNCDGC